MKPLIRTMLVSVFVLPTGLGCWGKTGGHQQVGGETNWLLSCESDADCVVGTCLCNVCTVECSSDDACGNGPPGSSCVTSADLAGDCASGLTSRDASIGICLAAGKDGRAESLLDTTLSEIAQDLANQPEADRPFLRYLSLQVDASAPSADGQTSSDTDATVQASLAAAKLANSLSTQPSINSLTRIDGTQPVARIDLREFGWNHQFQIGDVEYVDGWEAIVARAQLAVEYQGPSADQIQQLTGVRIPLLFADDFVAAASVGDLYYAFLGMPDSLQGLQHVLLPDPGTEVSVAFGKSGTSLGPRSVLRRSFRNGQRAYWQASDYGPSASDHSFVSNPESFPLGGTEVIYELPNGFHAYFLADGDGQRVDTSPLSPLTIRDLSQPDQLLRNSVSCYGCHQGGIVPIGNQPPTDGVDTASLQALQFAGTADDDGYLHAVQSLGIARGSEPISLFFLGFAGNLSLGQAAAKLFVTPQLISNQSARLPEPLRALDTDFGNVSRSTFASNYMDAFCTLQHDSENHPVACPRDRRPASSAGGAK